MNTGSRRIHLARPWIGDREVELVGEVLRSGVLGLGPFARQFEEAVAGLAGRRFGIACSSGTAGLHMAVLALGWSDGDEVLTTPFSFVASTNCLLYERVRPVFVDIEEDRLGIDPDQLRDRASARTVGVLPVHVFGRPSRIEETVAISVEQGWRMLEDSCEALGSASGGRAMGSFGDASVFAFYPNKQITTGEGGVVVTDDASLAATMRSLRNQGRDEDGTWLRHVRLGYNYRMDELSAALGVAQIERLSELRQGRDAVADWYRSRLGRHDWLKVPATSPDESVDWFVYVVRFDPRVDRDRVIGDLDTLGIPSRPYFAPLHLQPYYQSILGHRPGDFPVTERVAASTLAIPFSPLMSEDEVQHVCEALEEVVEAQFRH